MSNSLNDYKNMVENFTTQIDKIEFMETMLILELLQTLTRWEEHTRREGHNDIWYSLQMLSHRLKTEIVRRCK